MAAPFFSLIIPTVGRDHEVGDLLESIVVQQFPVEFLEIIIIDQNNNDLLSEIVSKYSFKLSIIHHKANFQSLSKAKNKGMCLASGQVINFCDDDAWFLSDTLTVLHQLFKSDSDLSYVFGQVVNKNGEGILTRLGPLSKMVHSKSFSIGYMNSILIYNAISLFIRREHADSLTFDEMFGLPYSGSEDLAYTHDLLKLCIRGRYVGKVQIGHPSIDNSDYNKRILYAKSHGQLCVKRRSFFLLYTLLLRFARDLFMLARCLISFDRSGIKLYCSMLMSYCKYLSPILYLTKSHKSNV